MIILNTPSAGSGGLPLTGGTLTGPVCVPNAANINISNARNAGILFGTSAAAANAGITCFNQTLQFYSHSTNDAASFPMQLNLNELGLASSVWLSWSSGNASGSKDLIIGRSGADTLQIGQNHATTPRAQCIKGGNVTTGTAAGFSLELAGGTGATGVRGNVTLNGGNRAAYVAPVSFGSLSGAGTVDVTLVENTIAAVSSNVDAIINALIAHGLMAAS